MGLSLTYQTQKSDQHREKESNLTMFVISLWWDVATAEASARRCQLYSSKSPAISFQIQCVNILFSTLTLEPGITLPAETYSPSR